MQEKQEQEEELKAKEAELMRGNPLINVNNSTSFNVKRRFVLILFLITCGYVGKEKGNVGDACKFTVLMMSHYTKQFYEPRIILQNLKVYCMG